MATRTIPPFPSFARNVANIGVRDAAEQVAEMVDGDVAVGNIWDEVEDTASHDSEAYLERLWEKEADEAEFQRDQADFMWAHSYEVGA